jgi:hypothetical protein
MDYEAFGVIGTIMRVIGILAALGVAAVAVGVAAYCTKKKLRPIAAWLLALSWAGLAFMFVVMAFLDRFILPRFGWQMMSYVNIGSELIFLVFGILMALSIGMFRPLDKAEDMGGEVGHGA